jgi:hypothetical protein
MKDSAKAFCTGVRGQLGPIVTHDRLGLAALIEEPVELASDPDAGDRGVGDKRQALARAIVDHDEDTQAAAIDELIGSEVERPAVIRPLRNRQGRACAQGPLAAGPPAHHEAFLAIDPKQPLVVHNEALPSQQHVQPAVAEAPAFMGKNSQPLPQLGILRPARAIPHHHPHTADDPARPPLAQLERRTYMSDSLSLGSGRHHFFARRSFKAALSSMASASSFLSLAFSLSSPFSRLASETSSPPYLAFQL